MGIWGQEPPSHGFRSVCKWMKPILWLGCYGCIFHGTGNLVQLCKNVAIGVVGGCSTPQPSVVRHWNWQTLCATHQSMTAPSRHYSPRCPQPYTVNAIWLQQTAAQIYMSEWSQGCTLTHRIWAVAWSAPHLCPARRPVTALDCILLKDRNINL
jgi:hypothetical protein